MSQTEPDAPAEPISELLGVRLLRTSGRLLVAHWWQLLAIASCMFVLHHLVMQVALWAYRAGALPGLLMFSFVPIVPLVGTALMLLVLRRDVQERHGATALIGVIGSVLIPFLVVYESQGLFSEDLAEFLTGGFLAVQDEQISIELSGGEMDSEQYERLTPDPTNPLLLLVVGIAFLLRIVGAKVADQDGLWEGAGAGRRRVRTVLRTLIGYAESVWIVIGVVVINMAVEQMDTWWRTRRFGQALLDWWASVSESVPAVAEIGERVGTAVGYLLDGVVTGLVTPLAWLTIGVVIYGLSAADTISEQEVVGAMQRQSRLGRMAQKVNPAVITLAWRRIADTEGRFGALLGGVAMILRSRFVPVLVFCLLYTLVSTWAPYAWWEILRAPLMGVLDWVDWTALYFPMEALSQIIVLCLTAPLLAAFTDALLVRFGARSQLRLPENQTAEPHPETSVQGTESSM